LKRLGMQTSYNSPSAQHDIEGLLTQLLLEEARMHSSVQDMAQFCTDASREHRAQMGRAAWTSIDDERRAMPQIVAEHRQAVGRDGRARTGRSTARFGHRRTSYSRDLGKTWPWRRERKAGAPRAGKQGGSWSQGATMEDGAWPANCGRRRMPIADQRAGEQGASWAEGAGGSRRAWGGGCAGAGRREEEIRAGRDELGKDSVRGRDRQGGV
jgi:hypothetical protein